MQQPTTEISNFLQISREHRGLSENTIKSYRQDLNEFRRFYGQSQQFGECSQATIMDYLRFMREEKGYKPATVRRRIVILRKFFDWFSNATGNETPFLGLELDLRVPKRLPRPIDRQTLQQLFLKAQPIVDVLAVTPSANRVPLPVQTTGLAMRVLISTGLRVGELTRLRLCDLSGAGSRIRVLGKGNRERTVYVTNERLLEDLHQYWCWRRANAVATDCLFLNRKGDRLTEAALRKRLRTTSEDMQLPERLTPHRFRHSAATLLIEEGVDIRVVQRLLGHASIATTELYTQVSDNSLFTAVERADTLGKVDF